MTTREPLYTEQDIAELLALGVYRDGLCPACGGPMAECTGMEGAVKFEASRLRCHRRTARAIAEEGLKNTEHPEALVWFTGIVGG